MPTPTPDLIEPATRLELFGTRNADTLTGSDGNDLIYGMGSDDRLSGGAGADLLFGGQGNDLLQDGAGHDFLLGGEGRDGGWQIPASPKSYSNSDVLEGELAMMNCTDKRGATGLMAAQAMICCQVAVGATRLCFAADKTVRCTGRRAVGRDAECKPSCGSLRCRGRFRQSF